MEAAAPLSQRCLHTIKQQARCKLITHLNSSHSIITTLPISHFPARRKNYTTRPEASSSSSTITTIRPFSTSRHVLQDSHSSHPQPTVQRSVPPPSTAPKPSIMGDLTKKLRTGSHEYVPDNRPLAEQLDIFADTRGSDRDRDIMDLMSSDPRKRAPASTLSRDDENVDQEALYYNLAGSAYRQSDEPRIALRLKPSLGRTQPLDLTRNMDLTAAFRKMERRCTDNNVKVDARNQRFYVRRGQRRKDDRRRRWRALFKEGFLHECARIRRMKAQGW